MCIYLLVIYNVSFMFMYDECKCIPIFNYINLKLKTVMKNFKTINGTFGWSPITGK